MQHYLPQRHKDAEEIFGSIHYSDQADETQSTLPREENSSAIQNRTSVLIAIISERLFCVKRYTEEFKWRTGQAHRRELEFIS